MDFESFFNFMLIMSVESIIHLMMFIFEALFYF